MPQNQFSVDVPSLGGAFDSFQGAYKDAQESATKRLLGQARQEAAQAVAAGDYKSGIAKLLGMGDVQGATALSSMDNNAWSRQHTAQTDARQVQRDAVTDQHWGADYGLRKAAAARADEGPNEKAAQRIKLLQSQGVDPASPEGRAYVISGEWSGPGTGGASLNPVYGVGADGKPAMVQPTKSGVAIPTKLPDGFQISREPMKMDLGTHYQLYDPQTRQPYGAPIPKNIAGVEQAKVEGDARGKAAVELPKVMATSQQILKTIQDVKDHPGKQWSLGMYSKVPTIPGSAQANFRAAAGQLKGQTFLQAYQTLRGGGAITDIEGAKGEAALARLDQAQTTEAYDAALDDFANIVKGGMLRASAMARGGASAPQSQSQGNVTSSGVKWSVQ